MLNRGTIKLLVFSTTSKSFLAQPAQNISSSSIVSAGKVWRQSNNLPKLQTARGPLIDLPDYSFVDGRPVPLSIGQLRRRELQNKLTSEIISGLEFIERAKQKVSEKDRVITKFVEENKDVIQELSSQEKSTKRRSKRSRQ